MTLNSLTPCESSGAATVRPLGLSDTLKDDVISMEMGHLRGKGRCGPVDGLLGVDVNNGLLHLAHVPYLFMDVLERREEGEKKKRDKR